ncbi:MAG: phosphoribosylaminoimidazolesuccinocarboxamide synthase, partial [Hyphomicrobiaceae bacterium]
RDLGGMLEAYQEVAKRLGVLSEPRPPKGAGPVLVASNGDTKTN